MKQNSYNLVEEPWIPVADAGLVSLRQVFTQDNLRALGGTPLQKIAVLKLLTAIAQAAHTPEDDKAWAALGAQGLSQKILVYLEQWQDRFWLYGERPFLQMPAVHRAALQEYGALMPEVSSGNTTVLSQWQCCPSLADADKALLLLVNMSCCFGGKKTDKDVVLSPQHSKSSAKSGPAICHLGLLHTFLTGASLRETVWLNVLSLQAVHANKVFVEGVGTAPWESMPQGEMCPTAEKLKQSLMGRLVPLARFCLLEEEGLRYVEGLQHPDYQQGYADPSASMRETTKKNQMLWCDPAKRPWRSLTALLGFLNNETQSEPLTCPLLRVGVPRLPLGEVEDFGIWSGGVKVSSNAGEQYLSGADDMVESEILLDVGTIKGEAWFLQLQGNMVELEAMSKTLFAAVIGYFKSMKNGAAESHARNATHLFWQLAELHFQDLVNACNGSQEERQAVMGSMVSQAQTAFQVTCPQDTARQMQAWARHRPRFGKFLAEK